MAPERIDCRTSTRAVILCALFALAAGALFAVAWKGRGEILANGDFSSYWLAGTWIREQPAQTPLYYPCEKGDRWNTRVWARIKDRNMRDLVPWLAWGRANGFDQPKFYLYPPLFAVLFAPFTCMPLDTAVRVWPAFNVLCWLAGVLLLAGTTRPRWMRGRLGWAVAVALLAAGSYPVWWTLNLGQNSLFLFVLWSLFLVLFLKGRDMIGGLVLAFLISIKLNPVLLIPWLLWRGRFRLVGFCLLFLALFTGISFAVAGDREMHLYFRHLLPVMSTGTGYFENQSLPGLLIRLKGDVDIVTCQPGFELQFPTPGMKAWILLLGLGQALPILLVPGRGSATGCRLELAAIILFLLIASPVSWSHHYTAAILVFALVARLVPRPRPVGLAILALSYVLIALPPVFHLPGLGSLMACPLAVSHRLVGALMLWVCLLALLSRRAIRNTW